MLKIIPSSTLSNTRSLYRWLEKMKAEPAFSSSDDRNYKAYVEDLKVIANAYGYKPGWVNFKSREALKDFDLITNSPEMSLEDALDLYPEITDPEYIKLLKAIIDSKEDIFIQGKAGSGKSTMISILFKVLPKVKVCTPTGTAAINLMDMGVQARTLHSQYGILVAPIPLFKDESKSLKNYEGTVIIDEISMVDSYILDLVMKNNPNTRFLFFGDMMQLQPVVTMEETVVRDFWISEYDAQYTWLNSHQLKKRNLKYLELQSVYRQDNMDFINTLNKVRDNTLNLDELQMINDRVMPLEEFEKAHPIYTHIVQTNVEARRINQIKYDENPNPEVVFYRESSNVPDPDTYAPEIVKLKEGCKVMCLHNIKGAEIIECGPEEYNDIIVSNGCIGKVLEIGTKDGLSYVKCDFNNRSLTIKPHCFFIMDSIKVNSLEEIPTDIAKQDIIKLKSGKYIYNKVVGSVTQLLLGVCYAITIHKSQGHTLNAAYLSYTYPCEAAAYVALSRVRSLNNLGIRYPIFRRAIVSPSMHLPYIEKLERFKY